MRISMVYRLIFLLLALTTVFTVWASCSGAAARTLGESRFAWILAISLAQSIILGLFAANVFTAKLWAELKGTFELDAVPDPLESSDIEKRPMGTEPLSLDDRQRLFDELEWLDAKDESVRRRTIQELVDRGDTPIESIRCWPAEICTELQLATAEALLREWGQELQCNPRATEQDLIYALFREESLDLNGPRIRTIAEPYPELPPEQPPQTPDLLNSALDRLHSAVKDTILDWKPELPEEDAEPEEEFLLGPLDRDRFVEGMDRKFDEVMEYLIETVSNPRTNFDLANTETEVGRFLHELRWDALNLALELRAPNDAG
ncbi:MAG TPA: hypothetical protein VKT80_07495, partial [Chloroflexota bacterium]|nr:hypothetical protein [Chloroflexota bacterium]